MTHRALALFTRRTIMARRVVRGFSIASSGLLAVVVLLFAPGCRVLTAEIPVERVVKADSERVLWDALRAAIYDEDYRVGGGADSAARKIVSGWKLDLQPFRGAGNRTRVIAKYSPVAKGADDELESFDVSIRIEKETNESLVNQLQPEYAIWKAADDDASIARRIMRRFHGTLGTAEIELSTNPSILDEID